MTLQIPFGWQKNDKKYEKKEWRREKMIKENEKVWEENNY